MVNQPVLYPRHVFRTARSVSRLAAVEGLLAAAVWTAGAINARGVTSEQLLLAVAALMVFAITRRVIAALRRMEEESPEPTGVMLLLFDSAMVLPAAGLLAVIAGARLVP